MNRFIRIIDTLARDVKDVLLNENSMGPFLWVPIIAWTFLGGVFLAALASAGFVGAKPWECTLSLPPFAMWSIVLLLALIRWGYSIWIRTGNN